MLWPYLCLVVPAGARHIPSPAERSVLWLSKTQRLPDDTFPPALPAVPTYYQIFVWPNPQGDSLLPSWWKGVFRIDSPGLDTLSLNFVGLTVDSVLVDGSPGAWTRENPEDLDGLLKVYIGSPPVGSSVEVQVFYRGVPSHPTGVISAGGLIIQNNMVFTDCEPYGSRYWYPCVDRPFAKVDSSRITVRVRQGWRVVANGVLAEADTTGSLWDWTWHNPSPIATYLIAFAARDYSVIRDTFVWGADTLPIFHYVYPWDSAAAVSEFGRMPQMLRAYSEKYGLYPFMGQKYAQAQAPLGGAMENQTNTFFGFSIDGSGRTDWVQAHELSHHWFGDWVTCGTWNDIWLNEGFATYSEAVWFEWAYGDSAYHAYIDATMDSYFYWHHNPPIPIYPSDEYDWAMFSVETYDKAGCVLHMARYLVGDTGTFFSTLRDYLGTHGGSWATTSQFTQEFDNLVGMDLSWFWDEWIYKPGHPRYLVEWSREDLGGSWAVHVRIEQLQDTSLGIPIYKMPLPVWVITYSSLEEFVLWDSLQTQEFTLYVSDYPYTLWFDPENWILEEHVVSFGVEEAPAKGPGVLYFGPRGDLWVAELAGEGEASLCVYDMAGRKLLSDVKTLSGEGTLRVNLGSLGAGVYMVRLTLNQKALISKKILRRPR